jgi:hypothetical protein
VGSAGDRAGVEIGFDRSGGAVGARSGEGNLGAAVEIFGDALKLVEVSEARIVDGPKFAGHALTVVGRTDETGVVAK